jgi:hypothetical protein
MGYRATWDRGCDAYREKTWQLHISYAKRTWGWASSAESTTHAVVPTLVEACTGQDEMPTTGGARDCWLLIDTVSATAVAALTTICEGVTTAGDKPMVAASM